MVLQRPEIEDDYGNRDRWGGKGKDVGFSIWSPTNRVVLFEQDRTHELDFEVVGTIRGDYRFDFDNRHSSFTDKKVTVSLCLI